MNQIVAERVFSPNITLVVKLSETKAIVSAAIKSLVEVRIKILLYI